MKTDQQHSGYTKAMTGATTYRFKHIPLKEGEDLLGMRDLPHKIVTVNTTLSDDKKCVHFNEYFAVCLSDAIAIAARLEIASAEVAEMVVSIEPLEPDEEEEFLSVDEELDKRLPAPVRYK